MLVCVGASLCSKSVGLHGVGIAEQTCSLRSSGEGRETERAQKGARSPPASGARARGEMDVGGLACAAISNRLRTFCEHETKSRSVVALAQSSRASRGAGSVGASGMAKQTELGTVMRQHRYYLGWEDSSRRHVLGGTSGG